MDNGLTLLVDAFGLCLRIRTAVCLYNVTTDTSLSEVDRELDVLVKLAWSTKKLNEVSEKFRKYFNKIKHYCQV